jgi:hypothetical protein
MGTALSLGPTAIKVYNAYFFAPEILPFADVKTRFQNFEGKRLQSKVPTELGLGASWFEKEWSRLRSNEV